MGKKKSVDDIILIDINVKSQERADEIVSIIKERLKDIPEIDIENIQSAESSWVIDGG